MFPTPGRRLVDAIALTASEKVEDEYSTETLSSSTEFPKRSKPRTRRLTVDALTVSSTCRWKRKRSIPKRRRDYCDNARWYLQSEQLHRQNIAPSYTVRFIERNAVLRKRHFQNVIVAITIVVLQHVKKTNRDPCHNDCFATVADLTLY